MSSCHLKSSRGVYKNITFTVTVLLLKISLSELKSLEKDWRAMAQIFQEWVDDVFGLDGAASEEELSEHDPENKDD